MRPFLLAKIVEKISFSDFCNFNFTEIDDELLKVIYTQIHTEVSRRRSRNKASAIAVNKLARKISQLKKSKSSVIQRHHNDLFLELIQDDWSSIYKDEGGDNSFYVYMHIEPTSRIFKLGDVDIKGLPFYVGKGCGNRAYDLKRNEGHGVKLRDLKRAGFKDSDLVLIFANGLSESQAFCLEAKLIYFLGTRFYDTAGMLVNLTLPKTPYD